MALHTVEFPPTTLSSIVSTPAISAREVIRCGFCDLNQFMTKDRRCRRCRTPLTILSEACSDQPCVQNMNLLTQRNIRKIFHDSTDAGSFRIPSNLRDLRNAKGMSQCELAVRMGIPRTYISKIERGYVIPTLKSISRIAKALDVPAVYLLLPEPWFCAALEKELLADPFMRALVDAGIGALNSEWRDRIFWEIWRLRRANFLT